MNTCAWGLGSLEYTYTFRHSVDLRAAMQGNGAAIAIMVAVITALGALGAPVVQKYLDDNGMPTLSFPWPSAEPTPTQPRETVIREAPPGTAIGFYTTEEVTMRANPSDNAAVIQILPPGTEVYQSGRAVDSFGVEWTKIIVGEGQIGWAHAPLPIEPVFHERP